MAYRLAIVMSPPPPPSPILDDRKSLSNACFAISDQYATFLFEFFFGSAICAILDDRKSLSIAFLAISDQYTTFFFGSPIYAKNNRVS